jgi:hypothetical protein
MRKELPDWPIILPFLRPLQFATDMFRSLFDDVVTPFGRMGSSMGCPIPM